MQNIANTNTELTVQAISNNETLEKKKLSWQDLFSLYETECNKSEMRTSCLNEIKTNSKIINVVLPKYLNASDAKLAEYKTLFPNDLLPIEYYQFYTSRLKENVNTLNTIDKNIAQNVVSKNQNYELTSSDNLELIEAKNFITSKPLKDAYLEIKNNQLNHVTEKKQTLIKSEIKVKTNPQQQETIKLS